MKPPFRVLSCVALLAGSAAAAAVDGESVYERACATCHGVDGHGVPGVFPPLNDSDYLQADTERTISAVVAGLSGEISVNGVRYDAAMPSMAYLGDDEVAATLTYVMEAWNGGGRVTAEQVARVRGESEDAVPEGRHPVRSEMEQAYRRTPSPYARRRDGQRDRRWPADVARHGPERQVHRLLRIVRGLPRHAEKGCDGQAADDRTPSGRVRKAWRR